jgi:hypothetical protein
MESRFWLILAASFGFVVARDKLSSGFTWRMLLLTALAAHLIVASRFTSDLKSSRAELSSN